MAADEGTVQRVREFLAERHDVEERRMFGGLVFMFAGHMLCGVSADHLMVRVGKAAHAEALAKPHARPMDFTGRPMAGFVLVEPGGYASDADLAGWIGMALTFVGTLPPK